MPVMGEGGFVVTPGAGGAAVVGEGGVLSLGLGHSPSHFNTGGVGSTTGIVGLGVVSPLVVGLAVVTAVVVVEGAVGTFIWVHFKLHKLFSLHHAAPIPQLP